jgi:hypothetical protein
MGLIEYKANGKYNVGQALKDGWGMEWDGLDKLVGLKLQDREDETCKIITILRYEWSVGVLIVHFDNGGWLALDHAIKYFKIKPERELSKMKYKTKVDNIGARVEKLIEEVEKLAAVKSDLIAEMSEFEKHSDKFKQLQGESIGLKEILEKFGGVLDVIEEIR